MPRGILFDKDGTLIDFNATWLPAYRLAAERKIQIRRLDYKRDSLEDIFLKAMEV